MIQCLGLSLRGHGPHASYEPTGQCLFKTNGLKDKLWRQSCRCATQLLAADAVYMTKGLQKTSLVQIALCVCLSSGLEVPPSCGQTLAHGKPSGRTKYHQNPERAKNAMLKTPSGIVSSLVRTGYNPVPFLPMKTPLANNSRWWVFGQQTEGIPAAINTYLQILPPRRSKSLGLVRFLSNLPHGRRLTM